MYVGALPSARTAVDRTSRRVALASVGVWQTPSRTLGAGFLDFISPIVGGFFAQDAAKQQAKSQKQAAQMQADAYRYAADAEARAAESAAQAAIRQAEIQGEAYKSATLAQMNAAKYAADLSFQASSKKADTDLAAVRTQYSAALDALQQQRIAAIDQQVTGIVANTSAAMFSLAGRGLAEAGETTRTSLRTPVIAAVVIALGTMALIRAPKFRRKKGKGGLALGKVAA